jgi:hypothetical protein
MINKTLKRAIAATAGVGLAFAGLVGIAAPAQAAGPVVTKFKIHLNVPKSVAEKWNLWYWSAGAGVEPTDNTTGTLTKTIGGVAFTQDWTPNFSNADSYGVYAEFTLPGKLTALNNVMRTTESWDGLTAITAVTDDPATPDVNEAVAGRDAIESADKPFGGDNIFPAGESWWNVGTGAREFPMKGFKKGTRTVKIHVNAPLADLQAKGFSLWAWNAGVDRVRLLKDVKVGKTYPYRGVVNDTTMGLPFTGTSKYGAFAVLSIPKEVGPYSTTGFILRRSIKGNNGDWAKQSVDWSIPNDVSDVYVNVGLRAPGGESWQGNYEISYGKAPSFVGRWGATATFANGKITVTPVRPTAAALRGAAPDTIVVTVKRGTENGGASFTGNKCTISTKIFAASIDDFAWDMASSCDVAIADADRTEDTTYMVFVQASASGIGTGIASAKENKRVVVPAIVVTP